LNALLSRELAPIIGPHTIDDVQRVAYMASSGGYQALEPALDIGNVPNVRDIYLLDAYYMHEHCALEHWLFDHLKEFDPARPYPRRFALVYTDNGGALDLSLRFKTRARATFEREGKMDLASFESEKHATLAAVKKPLSIVFADMMHDQIVYDYFWRLLAASGL
jgi:hypothetical protein